MVNIQTKIINHQVKKNTCNFLYIKILIYNAKCEINCYVQNVSIIF